MCCARNTIIDWLVVPQVRYHIAIKLRNTLAYNEKHTTLSHVQYVHSAIKWTTSFHTFTSHTHDSWSVEFIGLWHMPTESFQTSSWAYIIHSLSIAKQWCQDFQVVRTHKKNNCILHLNCTYALYISINTAIKFISTRNLDHEHYEFTRALNIESFTIAAHRVEDWHKISQHLNNTSWCHHGDYNQLHYIHTFQVKQKISIAQVVHHKQIIYKIKWGTHSTHIYIRKCNNNAAHVVHTSHSNIRQ